MGDRITAALPLLAVGMLAGCSQASEPYYPPQQMAAVNASANGAAPAATPAAAEVPTCEKLPASGTLLSGKRRPAGSGHKVTVENGDSGDAVIKVRNASNQQVVAAMFVQKNSKASLEGLPDGDYQIQYAFGALDEGCKKVARIDRAGAFPDVETFKTEKIDGELYSSNVTLTLQAAPGGNVRPQPLDPAAFDTE